MVNERTPLRKGASPPPYVFMTNPNKVYRKQVRQFQCCICMALLASFLSALVLAFLYSVQNDTVDHTIVESPTDNTSIITLLSMSFPLPDSRPPEWNMSSISVDDLKSALSEGKASLNARDTIEMLNPGIMTSSPSYRHQQSIKTSERARNLARSAYVMDVATKAVVEKNKILKKKPLGHGPVLNSDWLPEEECGRGPLPACPLSAYRTVDGSCNNPYKPNEWGVAMRPYRRQLPADYANGVSSPRVASDGESLPSARDVSTTVHRPTYNDDPKFTVMLAVWGQFIDHDITATASTIGAGGKALSCCNTTVMHPDCYPVTLSENDEYYKQYGVTCMEFIRSAPAPTCALGPREQMNQVSSYLDSSVVYGNTPELNRALRTFQGGKLKMSLSPDGRELLPISTNPKDGCNREEENSQGRYCFMSGDARSNENLHITSLHLLLARQHNLIALKLGSLNPEWSDEQIYQESRKIVSAQMQHITYNEFLPVILGPELMNKLELSPKQSGYYEGYNASIDPSISNNFATSSFRFGHTLLPGLMKVLANDKSSEEYIQFHKMLFNPFSLYTPGYLDMVLQGAINTNTERADAYFNKEVTQHLFKNSYEKSKQETPKYGLDLVSLNVQRGRDHGLPSYPIWREYCGLSRPKSFEDLDGSIDKDSLDKMKAIYKSVDDIDMYTGALSEIPIAGGMLGPTVTCLISDQFKRLKDGDSYFYETPQEPQGFTLGQLNEVRKTTLAQIICDTSDGITTIQPRVMETVRPGNERLLCSDMPDVDLTKWMSTDTSSKTKPPNTKIMAKVTSGNIATNKGDIIWDGTIPVEISLPLLDSVTPRMVVNSQNRLLEYEHGMQWSSSMSVENKTLAIKGIFSMPVYTHVTPTSGVSVSWLNGEFQFNLQIVWNSSNIDGVDLSGSYSSPVFLSEIKNNSLKKSNKEFVKVGAGDDAPFVIGDEKLPIVLKGSYSADRKMFLWPGSVIISVPNTNKLVPNDIKKLSTSLKSDEIKMNDNVTKSGFTIIGGNIKLSKNDESTSLLWNGDTPLEIPLPEFYNVVSSSNKEKSIVFYKGVVWSASITKSTLEGDFNVPQFYNGFDNFSITWNQGTFSFNVLPMWNTTLDEILIPGVKYVSRVVFHDGKLTSGVSTDMDYRINAGSLESFVESSQEVIDGMIPVLVVLYGSFSSEKFYWSGEAIVAVQKSKDKIDQQMAKLNSAELDFGSWAAERFGGVVEKGYVTAGLDNDNPKPIWSGNLPISIPIPEIYSPVSFLHTTGITWSASLIGSSIKGTYSLQQTMWNNLIPSIKKWSGEFSFKINPLWNTSLENVFVPGAKYYSKLNFQGVHDVSFTPINMKDTPNYNSELYAPIILQGTYSLDKKAFLWSGNFIISFKNGLSMTYTASYHNPKRLVNTPKGNTFSLTITSGSIIASPKGQTEVQVWSGNLPTTIPLNLLTPSKNFEKVTIANIVWSGRATNDTIEGQFSVPTYVENNFEELQWWTGNFSFKYTSKNSAEIVKLVSSGKKYNFKVVFTHSDTLNSSPEKTFSKLQYTVNLAIEAQDILESAKPGKLVLVGDFYTKPFYCSFLPLCSDKNEFYWSGDAFVSICPNNVQLSRNKLDSALQFGGKVLSGSIIGGSENSSPSDWWSGVLPIKIPMSIFYSPGITPVSGASIHHGLIWSGTTFANKVTGTFSLPQYIWNGISKDIRWWNGHFNFQIQSLWNGTLDGLVLPGVKYYSEIHLQGMKEPIMKSGVFTKPESFGEDDVDTMVAAPVILQGTYTPDGTSFIWSGDFMISFKNSYSEFSNLKISPEKIQSVKKSSDSSSGKNKPSKKSVSFKLTGGSVFGAKENETLMNIWSGKNIPIRLNVDLINKPGGYAVSADVKWKADQVTPLLSGQFAIPTYIKNDSSIITEMLYGNFSLSSETKYGATFDETVKPGNTYSCRVFFNSIKKMSSVNDDTSNTLQGNDSKSSDTIIEEPCNLILVGSYVAPPIYCGLLPFLCTDKKLFDWSGEGFLSFPVPKPPTINKTEKVANTNLKMEDTSNMLRSRTKIFATVLSGNLVGSRESEYPRILWSGNLPVEIPLPVFWTTDAIDIPDDPQVYGHGVLWSGTQLGMFFEGYFSLPQYAWNGISSSVQWWNGRFSFLLEPSLNSTINQIIIPGVKYNSRIVFQDSIYSKNLQTSPSQDDINYALHAPIVLQGHYSPDRKVFFWTGKVIMEFHTKPNPFYPRLITSSALNFMEENKIDNTTVNKNIGIVFTSINMFSNENITLKLPLVIPLKNISNKTTGSRTAKINWIATTITDTQLKGNFTLPTYTFAGDNITVESFSASFSSNIITLFNTTLDAIQPGIQYSSIIVFKSSKNVNSNDFHEVYNKRNTSIIIFLIGSLSPDEMFFTWTGQAWLKFPFTMSKTNKLTFKLGEKTNMLLNSVGEQSFFEPLFNDNITLLKENISTVRNGIKTSVGIVISSGNITASVDDNIKSLSFGKSPIVIPVHLITNNKEHMLNLEWTVAEVGSHLSGTFSLPLNTPDQNYTVAWISGKFTFEVTTLWATTLDVIQPGVKYSTVLLFQDKSKPRQLPLNGSLIKLITESDKNDGFQSGIITLTGTFSPDMMYFNWTGEAWLHFELNSQDTLKIKSTLNNENTECNKYGAAVVAGRITGNSFEGPQTYWSGALPVALSVFTFYPPFKAPHGILWSASGTESLLKGKFYFPKPVFSDVVWLTGNFEFQLRPLWNCSVNDLIQPDTKYYSKINFQELSSLHANQKALWTGEDFDKAHNLSITLQGFFSPDRSTFFWSGNFIVDFLDH